MIHSVPSKRHVFVKLYNVIHPRVCWGQKSILSTISIWEVVCSKSRIGTTVSVWSVTVQLLIESKHNVCVENVKSVSFISSLHCLDFPPSFPYLFCPHCACIMNKSNTSSFRIVAKKCRHRAKYTNLIVIFRFITHHIGTGVPFMWNASQIGFYKAWINTNQENCTSSEARKWQESETKS